MHRYKILFTLLMIGMTMLTTHSTVIATSIRFEPAMQTVDLGMPAEVDLVISDLENGSAPSVSTFDLDIFFDATILAFNNAVFGNQLDLFGLGSLSLATPGSGTVNLFELSFDLPDDLDALQADSFTLATLTFHTLAAGASPLSLTVNVLGDALGDPLMADISQGSITVQRSTAVVPEPGTIVMLLTGCIGLLGYGWRRQRQGRTGCQKPSVLS